MTIGNDWYRLELCTKQNLLGTKVDLLKCIYLSAKGYSGVRRVQDYAGLRGIAGDKSQKCAKTVQKDLDFYTKDWRYHLSYDYNNSINFT